MLAVPERARYRAAGMSPPFRLYRHDQRQAESEGLLRERKPPRTLGDHLAAAPLYQADEDLEAAVNAALLVGAPLLLTGEPGTGKTQVAFHLAHYFRLDPTKDLFTLYVRSGTSFQDLLYEFDAVAYFRAAHEVKSGHDDIDKDRFVERGPLWRAYDRDAPTILLIDEVDKAPRDFPNDLLNVLDQHTFFVRETGAWIRRGDHTPLVVITSNSERRLPEPFLRRCIFHHLEFSEDLVRRAVSARGTEFPHLAPELIDVAVERFMQLRGSGVRKPPATAELLAWLTILDARADISAAELRDLPLGQLPALAALVKDREDLAILA